MSADILQRASGNSTSTVLSISVNDTATSFTINYALDFSVTGGMIVIDEGLDTEEYAYYTSRSGSVLTIPLVNRGLEGSSANAHIAGATIKGILTSTMWNNIIDTLSNGFLVTTGAVDTTKVVTLTGTQTLTNKNLSSSTNVITLTGVDDRIIEPNVLAARLVRANFTAFGNNNASPYADALHFNTYGDGSGGKQNLVCFSKTSIAMRIYQETFGAATAYSTYDDVALLAATQTLSAKTLTTPVIASFYQDAGKTKLMTTPNTASDTLAALAATQTLTNKTIGTTNLISFNSPRGFLINGKIVPSVASNNLTVAIKGLDGNDPSATNPVYCRIGDTVRSITAALSCTKNAGLNNFNAGTAELATKEVDYFVYLFWYANATTPAVGIGFSRLPHYVLGSEPGTSGVNESYMHYNYDGSHLIDATCTFENIGRFAATLSAGAGYTWTVPTFTDANLIQRPIYESRLLSYQPTLTGTGFAIGTSTYVGTYQLVGQRVNFQSKITLAGITAGTGTDWKVALPFMVRNVAFNDRICTFYYLDSGTLEKAQLGSLVYGLSYVNIYYNPATTNRAALAYNAPITWANADTMSWQGDYLT